MNVYNFDFNLRQVVINGLKVKELENKYERTDYLYCLDNGLVFDDGHAGLVVRGLYVGYEVRSVDVDGGEGVDGAGDRGNYGVDLGHVADSEGSEQAEYAEQHGKHGA